MDDYTLVLDDQVPAIGEAGEVELSFQVVGPDGRPVTDYALIHEKEIHLIVVRRDLTVFRHVHPVRDGAGTWSVRLALPGAGSYRLFTDVSPAALGRTLTLAADLAIPGPSAPPAPEPLSEPSRTYDVDGYEVTLTGEPAAGEAREVTLSVREDGRPVTDLQPYLGAYGHLVVLRAGDLAYVHVHPEGEPGDGVTAPGPGISFHAELPGPGTYRFFLDFKHDDVVRTAEFTVETP